MEQVRGGHQKIPRPQNWFLGLPPPWGKIDHKRLTMDSIEESFRRASQPQPSIADYERTSSVMIPLYEHGDQVHMILTRRSKMMRHHTSEISFPGGNSEPQDTDEWSTAKREAHEEINLDRVFQKDREFRPFVTVGSRSFVTPIVLLFKNSQLKASPTK